MILSQLLLVAIAASIVGFFLGMAIAMFDLEDYLPLDLGYNLMPRMAAFGFVSAAALVVWSIGCVVFSIPNVLTW